MRALGRRTFSVTLDTLQFGFLQALAQQAGTTVDDQIAKMVEANLAQAIKAVPTVTVPSASNTRVHRRVSDAERAEMVKLRAGGMNYAQIAEQLGRPISVVWKNIKDMKVWNP